MKITLEMVAAEAGVSTATVSRVLNDKPGVKTATRRAVIAAFDTLGYEIPAHLRPTNGGLVGLMVPELINPTFPRFAHVIGNALARHGYIPVLGTQTFGGIREDDFVARLEDRGVVGIVFVSGVHAITDSDPGRYQRLVERGLPIVLINGYLAGVDATFLSTDDADAANRAVTHLAHLGHTRIGLATGPPRYTPVARRLAGFHDSITRLNDSGVAVTGTVELSGFTVEGGAAAADALVDQGVTAIVCGSDLMALGAIRAIHQRGLRVPQDVSVIGYDDSVLAEFSGPPLTTVRQPVEALCVAAVQALIEGIEHRQPRPTELIFQPELVVRDTTAAAPRGQ